MVTTVSREVNNPSVVTPAGISQIAQGETQVIVETSLVKENSIILVTPEGAHEYPLGIADKTTGEGFTVVTPHNAEENIQFNWLLINQE